MSCSSALALKEPVKKSKQTLVRTGKNLTHCLLPVLF